MKLHDVASIAAAAVSAAADRPAVALVHDHDDGRLVVFRIAPGQQVASHTSGSSVFLVGIAGRGFVSGAEGERPIAPGMVAAIEPHEPHGMRAGDETLVLAAIITPRPGSR